MTTDVATIPAAPVITDREIDSLFRVAKALAMSGFFKDSRAAEQAFAKILFGRDLGLSPTQAMVGIQIIEGKPELSANLQATFVRKYRGPDGERYDFTTVRLDDDACVLEFFRDGESLGTSAFTMEDAKRAELAGKSVWRKYPRNMLFARAMSNGVAFCCPEVTDGIRVYSEGEVGGEEKPPEVPEGPTLEAVLPPLPVVNVEDPEPVSDVPSDPAVFFNPPPPRGETPSADFLAGEFTRLGLKVADFRDMMRKAAVEPPADLASREKRLAVLEGLTEQQAFVVWDLLCEKAEQQ